MLRGLIVWLSILCLFSAAAAADQDPNCLTPVPHSGQAESAAITFSVLGSDGNPANADTRTSRTSRPLSASPTTAPSSLPARASGC